MRLNLYRVDGGYFVCPAGTNIPASHAADLQGRAPDMQFLSRDTAGRSFIEDHMRNNGAVLMDEHVAGIMLAGYPAGKARVLIRTRVASRATGQATLRGGAISAIR